MAYIDFRFLLSLLPQVASRSDGISILGQNIFSSWPRVYITSLNFPPWPHLYSKSTQSQEKLQANDAEARRAILNRLSSLSGGAFRAFQTTSNNPSTMLRQADPDPLNIG